jgi:16S rRNA (guanine527-N7)-methyltransferase
MGRWNKVLNLTRVHSLEEAVTRHYCESLFVALQLPPQRLSVLDVGSGAGFPGLPMAVHRPDCQFLLVESQKRKAAFLREASRDLPNVRVVAQRAEELDGSFDWVVSRAVAWEKLCKYAGKLGHSLALLLSAADAEKVCGSSGYLWAPTIPLPWSRQGVLLLGEVSST